MAELPAAAAHHTACGRATAAPRYASQGMTAKLTEYGNSLKGERVHGTADTTRADAQADPVDYIYGTSRTCGVAAGHRTLSNTSWVRRRRA